MDSVKDGKFTLFVLVMLYVLSCRVSSGEICPKYVPYYCTCEITDEAKSTLINMCSYDTEEGVGCKPCPLDLQDYENCTKCPGKTCPVCAPNKFDLEALQKSVSLDTFEDLKRIGHIVTSYSFKLAQNSGNTYRTGEDAKTRNKNATEDDEDKNEKNISDENQAVRSSNVLEGEPNREGQQLSFEYQTTRSLNITNEDQNQNEQLFSEESQISILKNVSEKDQNSGYRASSEQYGNTTDQYTYDDESVTANNQSMKTDIITDIQNGVFSSDDKNLNLNNSNENNVKIWYSGERYPSESQRPDIKVFEQDGNKLVGMKKASLNEKLVFLPGEAFRQPYLQTELPNGDIKGEKMLPLKDKKPSDSRSLLIDAEQESDNFGSNNSSMFTNKSSNYSDDSSVKVTEDGTTLNPIALTISSQSDEVYFLRGENSRNESLSGDSYSKESGEKSQYENTSSKSGDNSSRNVRDDEKNNKMTIEEESKTLPVPLTRDDVDEKTFRKNNYVKDAINHVFYDERNSTIQTLAFDVVYVNYLKYSTGMPDLTTFYFTANLSPEEKVDINLVRICFLNQNSFTITAGELNLCRKKMDLFSESSSLLTVRVQNSHIFKEFYYNEFDEGSKQRDENPTLLDESSLSTNESDIFNGHDYKLLRKGAKKFVHDSFDFRKLYDLWEMPENESSDTFRFCHDTNVVRVCKNYKDGIRVHSKIDNRFRVFISAYLNRASLFDLPVAEFVQTQLPSGLSYLISNVNAKTEGKEKIHRNKQFITFTETGLGTVSYEEKGVPDNKSLEIMENASEENSMNSTDESLNDFGNEKTNISFSDDNEKLDLNRSEASTGMNISSTMETTASYFGEETENTEEVSFNDTSEEELSEINEPQTEDIQEYDSEFEQVEGTTRNRRAINSTKQSPSDWCNYTNRTYNGSITCNQWTYKKECTIHCYPGHDYAGEKAKQFTCRRKDNVWVPELTPCLKGSVYTNDGLGLENHTDENMKSHKDSKDENADVSTNKASTEDGLKEKDHNLLSNYDAHDFDFANYAYDKYNDDSQNDEYE